MRTFKQKLTAFAVFFMAMGNCAVLAQDDNYLSVEDLRAAQGGQVVLPILLTNDADVCAYSFELTLPEGITVAKNSSDKFIVDAGARADDHTVSANFSESTYYFACLSLSSTPFTGNSGSVCNITLNVDNTVELGDKSIEIKNIEIACPDNTKYNPEATSCNLTVVDASSLYDKGFSIQLIPIEFNEDVSDIPFSVESTIALTNIEFDVELPSCIGQNELYDLAKSLGTTTATTTITGEYGSLHVSIARKNTKTISSGSNVAKLELGFDGDLISTGIYNVEIKNIVLTGNDGVVYHAAPTTSYIKVGNPNNASLALKGHVSEDMNAALAEDESIGMLDLSDVVSMDGTLTLVDKRGLVAPKQSLTVEKVSYIRAAGNAWGTICLPFTVVSDSKVQYYTLETGGVDLANGKLTFTEASTVPAGTPAVFCRTEGESLSVSASNVEVKAGAAGQYSGGLQMLGTYEPTTITGDNYFIAEDAFWKAETDEISIPAFRAYFKGMSSEVKNFSISLDNETGLKTVSVEMDKDAIYDLMGRNLLKLQKGINIVNGKKILVK